MPTTYPAPPTRETAIEARIGTVELEFRPLQRGPSWNRRLAIAAFCAAAVLTVHGAVAGAMILLMVAGGQVALGLIFLAVHFARRSGHASIVVTADRIDVREHDGFGLKHDVYDTQRVASVTTTPTRDAGKRSDSLVLRIEERSRTQFHLAGRPAAEVQWAQEVIETFFANLPTP